MDAGTHASRADGARVLLVEGEQDIAELVVTVLADEGYAVTTAPTLEDALARLRDGDFDLVLVDGLSADSEQAFANALTVLRAAGSTPVVLFTTHRREPDEVWAAGFADLITKPFNIDDFAQRVRALLVGMGRQDT